jgi:glycosyltransferase involved in cell wall biosynthesis
MRMDMANLLLLNPVVPFPPNHSGNTIRVFPLSVELSKRHDLFLAVFEDDPERLKALDQTKVFKNILAIPQTGAEKGLRRYLFFKTGNLDSVSRPSYYMTTTSLLRKYAKENHIDLVLIYTLPLAEYGENIPVSAKVIDQTDCRTLLLKRAYSHSPNSRGIADRIRFKAEMLRAVHQEGRLTTKFDFVTTVSPVDRETLVQISRQGVDRIVVVPNGVAPEFLSFSPGNQEEMDAVAFWGALDFPPNREAVHFFYENVYVKYLQNTGVKWFIIGKNPGNRIVRMGQEHENIIVTGFLDNLVDLVSRIPVVINPMKMGSGLKNKVLEAFALGKLVISTSMGMEATGAESGVHFARAETGEEFAKAIFHYLTFKDQRKAIAHNARGLLLDRYTWERVGRQFCELVDVSLHRNGH